jgi:hypothetical protein
VLLRSCAFVLSILGGVALAGPVSITNQLPEPVTLPNARGVPAAGELKVGDRTFAVDPVRAARVDNSTTKPVPLYAGEPVPALSVRFLHTFVPGAALHDYRMQVAAAHRAIEVPPNAVRGVHAADAKRA